MKTKNVAGHDLNSDAFLYVGAEHNTDTWLFAVRVPGDDKKSSNPISSALNRFEAQAKKLTKAVRYETFLRLCGAAQAHGIRVDPAAVSREKSLHALVEVERSITVMTNDAEDAKHEKDDYAAMQFLKRLGID